MRALACLAVLLITAPPALAQEFQTPSGNIACAFFAQEPDGALSLRCDIGDVATLDPRPADCDLDWGHAFGLGRQGQGERLCAGDTISNPSAPILHYGSRIESQGLSCTIAPEGVTCRNKAGGGFSLSRAMQTTF